MDDKINDPLYFLFIVVTILVINNFFIL